MVNPDKPKKAQKTPFQKFQQLAKAIIAVPKKRIQDKHNQQKPS